MRKNRFVTENGNGIEYYFATTKACLRVGQRRRYHIDRRGTRVNRSTEFAMDD